MSFASTHPDFEIMVRAYSSDLYRFAYWLCRNRSQAEDLVQETYTRAWKAWHNVRDEHAIKSWLFTILRNEHARLYERKRIEIDEQDIEELNIAVESSTGTDLDMQRALQILPQSYREPLVLQVLGGFSCAEIAQMLSIKEPAVMTRLTRARQTLRKLLEPEQHATSVQK